jgi:mitochondrial chaperone BCS1
LYLGKAGHSQKIELYRRFFPEASEFEAQAFVETYRSAETMAEFQDLLLGLEQGQEGGTAPSQIEEILVAKE